MFDVFDSSLDYVIFDDIPMDSKPMWKSFLGGQHQFTITDKYMKKKSIIWGKPCIFVCNEDHDPRLDPKLSSSFIDWLSGNCVYVDIENKLF